MGAVPSVTTKIVAEQRKRLVASVMRAAETSTWWRKLTPEEQGDFREDVLSSINVFYELVRDIVKVSEDELVSNDYVVKLIEKMHADQQALVTRLARVPAVT